MGVNNEKSWLCWEEWKLVHLFEKNLRFTLEMSWEICLFVPPSCDVMALLCSHCLLAALAQQ